MESPVAGSIEHPYHPPNADLPNYLANTLSVPALLALFALGAGGILSTTYVIVTKARPRITRPDALVAMWFGLCGFIHLFFEGYFAYNNATMPSRNDLFGQLWKEYALSDIRYLTRDPFLVCMESVTALCWGPLSYLTVALIAMDHPARHVLQLIISLGQMYGDILYYSTVWFEVVHKGAIFCRPERYYFWAYFFLMNAFWIVIPLGIVVQSAFSITNAFRTMKRYKAVAGKKSQ